VNNSRKIFSSLDLERDLSSTTSEHHSQLCCSLDDKGIGREKEGFKNFMHSLNHKYDINEIENTFQEYSVIFDESKEDFCEDLIYLFKNKELIRLILNQGAFTKTRFYDYLETAGYKYATRTVKNVIEKLFEMGILELEQVETGIKPAEIYYFPKLKQAISIKDKLVKFFADKFKIIKSTIKAKRDAMRVKKEEKTPEEIAEKSVEIWDAQSKKAENRRLEKIKNSIKSQKDAKKIDTEDKIRKHLINIKDKKHRIFACNTCRNYDQKLVLKIKKEVNP
jgi:hypothetical protein